MGHRTAAEGRQILICAPYGRDADSVTALLRAEGYDVAICPDLAAIAANLSEAVGAILLTEEALRRDLDRLKATLAAQPSWSDIPFVLLAAAQKGRTRTRELTLLQAFDLATNSIVLERPLGKASLISALSSVMRARQKQFEMRDRMMELAESEASLRLATSAADIGIWDYDPVSNILRWDGRCRAKFGLSQDAPVTYEGTFVAGLHPDDRTAAVEAVDNALDPAGDGEYDIEYRTIGLEDGIERWIAARGSSIFIDGRATRFIGTVIDITESKSAEASLDQLNKTLEDQVADRTAALEAEMASRTRAETALRQSQKMEAIGQLTGGIAHDFNNMLTGVIGGLDIIQRRIATGRFDDLDRFMDAASSSAQRAAALTARLLAFSRRQSLDAKPIDVNALALSLEDLLCRTLRENIALTIIPGDKLMAATADANQLENAIINLAINARDAMPDGGQLTIEMSMVELDGAYALAKGDIEPGHYVMIAVSDTGVGMAPELLEKIFDPFFTTKPIGQGTGLGLSMVYGFAQQSGGQVRVHSRPGEGTSVKICLPASREAISEPEPDQAAIQEGSGQTVLFVEDDESVRLLIRDVLAELSYDAVEAANADEAVPILMSSKTIDLLISDVGLPGMNGRQLAEIARQHRPDLPILFVTGYAENAAIRAGFLGTNMAMITKPFAIEGLAAKIDEMIRSAA